MKTLTTYVNALNCHDADCIASLFTEDCVLLDRAPRLLVGGDLCVEGRENVRRTFSDLFAKHYLAAELVVDMGNRAIYNVTLDRTLLKCVCHISQPQGLIKAMKIDLR